MRSLSTLMQYDNATSSLHAATTKMPLANGYQQSMYKMQQKSENRNPKPNCSHYSTVRFIYYECEIIFYIILTCKKIIKIKMQQSLANYLRNRSSGRRCVCVRTRRTRSERSHALRHSVGQNELFSQFDVGATLGCMRAASDVQDHNKGGIGKVEKNRSVKGQVNKKTPKVLKK